MTSIAYIAREFRVEPYEVAAVLDLGAGYDAAAQMTDAQVREAYDAMVLATATGTSERAEQAAEQLWQFEAADGPIDIRECTTAELEEWATETAIHGDDMGAAIVRYLQANR